jgi:hypothetical protein
MVGGSTAGVTTYTVQQGYYTRIGNLVDIQFNVQGSAATGTGNAVIGGFPFTIKNQTGGNVPGSVLFNNSATWTWPASTTSPVLFGQINTTTSLIWVQGTAGFQGNLQMANASFVFIGSLTYRV